MFEESKIWVLITLAAIVISCGYCANYLSSVDEATAMLLESKTKLASVQEQLSYRKNEWEKRGQTLAKIQAEADKHAILLKNKDLLDIRYNTVSSGLNYVLESTKTSVEKTRTSKSETELGDVTLTNGKILRAAKMRKADDSGISIIHADGIGTISPDLLPANLLEKYDLGPDALASLAQEAKTAFVTKPKDTEIKSQSATRAYTPTTNYPTAQTPTATMTVDDAVVKKIKYRMAELDSQIENLERSISQYKENAQKHESLATSAKGRGQPSTRHTLDANESLAHVAVLERQLTSIHEARNKLDIELEYAQKGK